VVAEFFRGLLLPPADYETVWARHPAKQALFLAKLKAKLPIPPEIPALINSLKNYKLGVVSASSRFEIEPALEAAGILRSFEVVIGTEDVNRSKPAPDPYLLALRRLSVSKALAVEDSDTGAASACAAGLDVLRVRKPTELPTSLRKWLMSDCR
jgi:HAD superfamily hydrolase (TIGR01509 family)